MSITKASYAMINGASLSVLDFGADPTGTDNSAPAIQAAIDSLSNTYEKAKAIYFPAGIYKITSTLTVDLVNAASLTFYSDTKATINVRVPAANFGIDVDYSTGGTANFLRFDSIYWRVWHPHKARHW
jgi:polygalacturonase